MATTVTEAPLANMGPHLRGVSPPFTPTGNAAMTAQNVSFGAPTEQRNQAGHAGIIMRVRVDRQNVERLLPHPLEPHETTDEVYFFLNQTQTGKSREFILGENPQLMNWHEVCIMIPCRIGDTRGTFLFQVYKDPSFDSGIVLGTYRGFANKTAQFTKLFPFPGQPLNREMAPGGVARMIVTRMGEKIIDCAFRAERELTSEETARELHYPDFFTPIGLRYFPDWADPNGPPLVHDLVVAAMEHGHFPRAWAGEGTISFGETDDEELHLFQPLEIVSSHFVHANYRGGPGVWRVAHDYVERRRENGRVVHRRTSDMGPHLRGASPPFTPSGKAAFARSTDLGGGDTGENVQAGHIGILARWRADRRNAEMLLPRPLEPVEHTDEIYLFLNQTQTGLNMFGVDLRSLNPTHVNWHEALFMIPCLCKGEKAIFVPIQYKDVDHGVILGIYDGFWTKLATFHETFPFAAQPLNAELGPGGVARMNVSRYDERIITCEFRAEAEVPPDRIAEEIDADEFLNDVGVRYWPDYARPGEPPLAHDLVMWDMGAGAVARAWRGEISLTFGRSNYDELHLLEPIDLLPSHFIYLQYQGGPGLCSVVHDYTVEPLTQ